MKSIKTLQYIEFSDLFFLKKARKWFIRLSCFDNIFLVFDIINQCFYLSGDIIPHTWDKKTVAVRYSVDKSNLLYEYDQTYFHYRLLSEVKAFQYSNDKLVETGKNYKFIKNKYYIVYAVLIV